MANHKGACDMKVYRERLSTHKKAEGETSPSAALNHGKVLIICANADTSIVSSDLVVDATDVFEGNVQFRHLDAGHDVPISKSREFVAAIWGFWTGLAVLSPYEQRTRIGFRAETVQHAQNPSLVPSPKKQGRQRLAHV